MHRVELKDLQTSKTTFPRQVPNAPCGVESISLAFQNAQYRFVPNAPCGVERSVHD